jgi:hypothetical protein
LLTVNSIWATAPIYSGCIDEHERRTVFIGPVQLLKAI